MAVEDVDRLLVAAGLDPLLQDVADRGDERRLRLHGGDRVEQRQQLEPHLPATERIGLDHDDVRLDLGKRLEQQVAAARLVGVVDRPARQVGEAGEALIGRSDRRQLDRRDARSRESRAPERRRSPPSPRSRLRPARRRRGWRGRGGRCRADAGRRRGRAGRSSARSPFLLEQRGQLADAGMVVECGPHLLFGRRAQPLAQRRIADGALERCGQRWRVLRRHQQAVLAVADAAPARRKCSSTRRRGAGSTPRPARSAARRGRHPRRSGRRARRGRPAGSGRAPRPAPARLSTTILSAMPSRSAWAFELSEQVAAADMLEPPVEVARQQGERVEQHVEALLLDGAADAEDQHRSVGVGAVAVRAARRRTVRSGRGRGRDS